MQLLCQMPHFGIKSALTAENPECSKPQVSSRDIWHPDSPARMIYNLTLELPPWSRAHFEPLANKLVWGWNSPNAGWQKLEVKIFKSVQFLKDLLGT